MTIIKKWLTHHGDRVEVFTDERGEYRWNVTAGNGEIVGQGESHPDLDNAISAAERHHPPVPSGT